ADDLIRAVGNHQKTLLAIRRERNVPGGPATQRLFGDEGFLNEGSVFPEHLNTIVGSIAHVHESVISDAYAMDDAELWRRRTSGIVLTGPIFVLDHTAEWARQTFACL